jgi:hypothetical protein
VGRAGEPRREGSGLLAALFGKSHVSLAGERVLGGEDGRAVTDEVDASGHEIAE